MINIKRGKDYMGMISRFRKHSLISLGPEMKRSIMDKDGENITLFPIPRVWYKKRKGLKSHMLCQSPSFKGHSQRLEDSQ